MLPRRLHVNLTRLVCLLLALHFLNLSIDSRDPNPDAIPEDLSFNDIESVTEFFAEIVLNRVNAFAEHDERDINDGGAADFHKFYCASSTTEIEIHSLSPLCVPQFQIRNVGRIESMMGNVSVPPPKS